MAFLYRHAVTCFVNLRLDVFAWIMAATLFLLTTACFSPRFVNWQHLGFPPAQGFAAVNRAYDTLHQVDAPFASIATPTNKVIQWRLLFPIIFHYLHWPKWLFLAMPFVGCVLALAFTIERVASYTEDRLTSVTAAGLIASASWLFVSTGWLTYFDAWYILAGVAITLLPSRFWLILAVLLTPWIDERIILMLPLCLLLRAFVLRQWADVSWRDILIDTAIACALTTAYVAVRLISMATTDADSSDYFVRYANIHQSLQKLATGAWMGLRWGWLPVLLLPALLFKSYQRRWLAPIIITLAGTTLVALLIAADYSRSISMLVPALLVGVIAMHHHRPSLARKLIVALFIANLLTPASHVVATWTVSPTIRSVIHEFALLRDPPEIFTPAHHVKLADICIEHDKPDLAVIHLKHALQLDFQHAPALAMRGNIYHRKQRNQEAIADYRRALRYAPVNWPARPQVASKLRSLLAEHRANSTARLGK